VSIEIESSAWEAMGHVPLSQVNGVFGRSDLLEGVARISRFQQPVVAIFEVAADLVGDDYMSPGRISIEERRFANAERILRVGETDEGVEEGGNVVIYLREGIKVSVTWFDPESEENTGILRRD